jgi:hypothetical protein
MKKELLSNWWRMDTTDADMKVIRWIALGMGVFFCSMLISQLDKGEFVRGVSSLGILMVILSYTVGPQCLRIIEAAENSNSRKALTIIALIGFLLHLSSLLVLYTK